MDGWLRPEVVTRTPRLTPCSSPRSCSPIFYRDQNRLPAGAAQRLRGLELQTVAGCARPSVRRASALVIVGGLLGVIGRVRPRDLHLDGRELARWAVVVAAGWCSIQFVVLVAGIDVVAPTPSQVSTLIAQLLVTGPVEEIIYRGVLLPQLARGFRAFASERVAVLGAIVGSAAVFAASHLPGLRHDGVTGAALGLQLAALFAMGIVFALLYLRSGRLLVVAALHALLNSPTPFLAPTDGALIVLQAMVLAGGAIYVARGGTPGTASKQPQT